MYNPQLISIIMPAFNAQKTIAESVTSVLAQDYLEWELIIINDCSVDQTKDIAQEFVISDPRVKLLTLEKNVGIAKARNTGIQHATGRYLAFLDSDDVWKPNKLSTQLQFMVSNDYSFSFTSYELMDFEGQLLGKTIRAKKVVDYRTLLPNNCIGCLTVMIDRKQIPDVIMPEIKHEDFATWLNILKKGIKAFGLEEPLSVYRVSEFSTSANKLKVIPWIWSIYRQNQGFGIIRSSLLLMVNVVKLIIKYFRTGMLKKVVKRVH